jgi:hypothetical protein
MVCVGCHLIGSACQACSSDTTTDHSAPVESHVLTDLRLWTLSHWRSQVVFPFQGVQLNHHLLDDVCQVCQDVPYSHVTTVADIENCKSRGNVFAAAAKSSASPDRLALVAMLLSSDLVTTSSTSSASGPFNGAFWYYFPGKSFGFASVRSINIYYVDESTSSCEYRLSWHLDGSSSGWRAGCATEIRDSSWRKVMYACGFAPGQVREVPRRQDALCPKHNEIPKQPWHLFVYA